MLLEGFKRKYLHIITPFFLRLFWEIILLISVGFFLWTQLEALLRYTGELQNDEELLGDWIAIQQWHCPHFSGAGLGGGGGGLVHLCNVVEIRGVEVPWT